MNRRAFCEAAAAVLAFGFIARGRAAFAASPGNAKILVAYFSATGTTAAVAKKIAEASGATLFEIAPERPYSHADLDWQDKQSRSSLEMKNKSARPAIKNKIDNMGQYEAIFIGYPIWWGQAPRIINTFLESYNFTNKTIIPFCTSGGSPIGSSAKNLHSLAAGAKWLDGRLFSGHASSAEIKKWLDTLNLGK